jgi:hypothetical protein
MEEHSTKQHSAPAFLEKLYEILEDPKLDEYIGKWFKYIISLV